MAFSDKKHRELMSKYIEHIEKIANTKIPVEISSKFSKELRARADSFKIQLRPI